MKIFLVLLARGRIHIREGDTEMHDCNHRQVLKQPGCHTPSLMLLDGRKGNLCMPFLYLFAYDNLSPRSGNFSVEF